MDEDTKQIFDSLDYHLKKITEQLKRIADALKVEELKRRFGED